MGIFTAYFAVSVCRKTVSSIFMGADKNRMSDDKYSLWKKRAIVSVMALSGLYAVMNDIAGTNKESEKIDEDNPYIRSVETDKEKQMGISSIYAERIKPAFDKILSFIALLLLSPIFALISIAILIDDPGPVFFTQKRVGKNKKFFTLHKFRSMKMSTPHDVPTHQLENPEQYITKVGKVLRKTSLDELPQIWDIFRGKMSIIGPRPALWNQIDLVAEREKYGANDVMPGLTGWAQINGRDELEIGEKARLDGEYTEILCGGNLKGFALDGKCFAKTITSVLKSDGVMEGGTGNRNIRKGTCLDDISLTDAGFDVKKAVLILVNHDVAIYNFRLELVERLLSDGYEVHISSPIGEHTEELKALGVHFHEISFDRHGMNPIEELNILREYYHLMKLLRPLIVFTYTIKCNVYGGIAAYAVHVPFCANVTGLGTVINGGGVKEAIVLRMYKMGLKGAQRVFFQNEENKKFMTEKGIVTALETVLPGSGVNLKVHCFEPYPEENKGIVFSYIGRIMKDKGIDELLDAVREVKKHYPSVTYRLIGFFDGAYEKKIKKAEKENMIVYIPQQHDIHPWMAESHAIIMPSYHEGMSNVLLEAAATGRPVLASNIPGCREAFDKNSGIGFKTHSCEALVKAIERFIILPYESKVAMGKAGRKKMEREFSRDIVVEKYMEEVKKAEEKESVHRTVSKFT